MGALKQQINEQRKLIARPQADKSDLKARAEAFMKRYPKTIARLAQ